MISALWTTVPKQHLTCHIEHRVGERRQPLSNDSGGELRYGQWVNIQIVLKQLFELRAVLDRLGESDITLHETLAHDVERAIRLTNSCISQLTQASTESGEAEEDEDE